MSVLVLCLYVMAPIRVAAQQAVWVGSEGAWSLYRNGRGSNVACWIVAQTFTRTGPRQPLFLSVTKFPDRAPEISIFVNGNPQKIESANLIIRGQVFELVASAGRAWSRSIDDAAIVAGLEQVSTSRQAQIAIRWGGVVNLPTDVSGFSKAYRRNIEQC